MWNSCGPLSTPGQESPGQQRPYMVPGPQSEKRQGVDSIVASLKSPRLNRNLLPPHICPLVLILLEEGTRTRLPPFPFRFWKIANRTSLPLPLAFSFMKSEATLLTSVQVTVSSYLIAPDH